MLPGHWHPAGAGHTGPRRQMAERSSSWLEPQLQNGGIEQGTPRGLSWNGSRSPRLDGLP